MQAIQMICVHDEEGNIRPYRFKMRDDAQVEVVVHVKKVIDKTKEKSSNNYTCISVINDQQYTFHVKYFKDRCQWWLMKVN